MTPPCVVQLAVTDLAAVVIDDEQSTTDCRIHRFALVVWGAFNRFA
jgi:hypothetical protein